MYTYMCLYNILHTTGRWKEKLKIEFTFYKAQSLYVFFLFCFETTLKNFQVYFFILLTFCFKYLQIHIKECCLYLSSQLFFRTL